MFQFWARLRVYILGHLFPRLFPVDSVSTKLVRIGSAYGGWWVPEGLIGPESVCYLAGVGKDITFDLGLISRFDCRVWGIDPTPASIEWIRDQSLPSKFVLVPKALAGGEGTIRLYLPRNSDHVSHSAANLQGTTKFIQVSATTVKSLAGELRHDSIDVLKLDIEGAEHAVIDSFLGDGIRPRVLCVEFDQPEPLHVTRRSVAKLRASGYLLAKVDWFNMTFIYSAPLVVGSTE